MERHRIYVFQHVACEPLGTFAHGLATRGFAAEYVRLYAGETIPTDWSTARALIFLGGPMSVNDEDRHAYLAEEKAIIRQALRQHNPVLGICLGAQLLAAAAGSRVFPGVRPEIGWEAVTLSDAGRDDPLLAGVSELGAVVHWHGETFDLPAGAVRLASSTVTPNQAFRLGDSAYGLQFHVEVDAQMIDEWVGAYPHDLGPNAAAAARRIAAGTALHLPALQAAAGTMINHFLDVASRVRNDHSLA